MVPVTLGSDTPTPRLRLDRAEALRYLGYTGQELDEVLCARFERLVESCERTLHPACVHAVFAIDEERSCWDGDGAHVAFVGIPLMLEGCSIAAHLRGARKAALMACTLGAAGERELRKYGALGPTDALLYDAAASALIEAAADAEEAAVAEQASAVGLHANFRFSPGYGDLPLMVQPAFLAALDATRRIGLSVTKNNLLVPTKSITAVIGLFDQLLPDAGARDACAACQLRADCQFRKKGITCHG